MARKKPTDPAWANSHELDRARKALVGVDPRLDLWWDATRERWKVMEYVTSNGIWSYAMFWVGPNGEYRDPSGGFDDLLRKLADADCARYGQVESGVHKHLNGPRGDMVETKKAKDAEQAERAEYAKTHTLSEYLRVGETKHEQSDMAKGGSRHALHEAADYVCNGDPL